MHEHTAEQKRLVNDTKAKEKALRQATQAAQQARNALENKTAELDNARNIETDLQQKYIQATQVTNPLSLPHLVTLACWCNRLSHLGYMAAKVFSPSVSS